MKPPSRQHGSARVAPAFALLVLLAAACAPYRLGTTLPAHLRSVHVPTFTNSTPEPGIEVEVTNEVVSRFRIDGNLAPVSREAADSLLEGEITGWDREVLIYAGDDRDEVEEYRLVVTAAITFHDFNRDRELITRRLVRGQANFVIDANMAEAERAARPEAFRDLARRIVDEVTSYW